MRQTDLSDRRGRLAVLEPQRTGLEAQAAAPERNRARGHQDYLLPAPTQPQEILDQGLEPGAIDTSAVAVDQERRAHLHDDESRPAEGRCGIGSAGGHMNENYT